MIFFRNFRPTVVETYEPTNLDKEIISGEKIIDSKATELFLLLQQAEQSKNKNLADIYRGRLQIMEDEGFVPLSEKISDEALKHATEKLFLSIKRLEEMGLLNPSTELKEKHQSFYDRQTRRAGDSARASKTFEMLFNELKKRGLRFEEPSSTEHEDTQEKQEGKSKIQQSSTEDNIATSANEDSIYVFADRVKDVLARAKTKDDLDEIRDEISVRIENARKEGRAGEEKTLRGLLGVLVDRETRLSSYSTRGEADIITEGEVAA